MSYFRRQRKSKTVLRLEQLERRDAPAVLTPTTFANAGISVNTAVRQVEGGLYALAVQESNQAISTVATFITNLTNVRDTINAERAVGGNLHNVSTATNGHLNTIVADLTKAINNAPNQPTGATAETNIHAAMTQILNVVNGDATLRALARNAADIAAAAPGYASVGFQQIPRRLPAGVTFQNAPRETLAQIGRIFDDASNRLEGGNGNAANKAAIIGDLNAVKTGFQDLEADHPELFGDSLTRIHANTIVVQIPLEIQFINDVGIDPAANHGTRDVQLDLIDIVQGDVNLANMASQGGVTGFNVFPDPRTAPTRYQDNHEQTIAIATEIAQGNTLGVQAIDLVTNHPEDTEAINALIEQFQDLSQFAENFVTAQPDIFRARFDNEQLSDHGTQRAVIDAMIEGLRTENVELVTIARQAISANWADNAGNNIPESGGTYNVDGFTIDQVLSTAHNPSPHGGGGRGSDVVLSRDADTPFTASTGSTGGTTGRQSSATQDPALITPTASPQTPVDVGTNGDHVLPTSANDGTTLSQDLGVL
jgi:hypothetical protein